jgi:mRNA interferase RelE/StbE
MATYQVVVSKQAAKEIEKLTADVVQRIIPSIVALANNPRPAGCKKLKGGKDLYRIRVGDYRLVYSIEDTILVVDVRRVAHRRDVYD